MVLKVCSSLQEDKQKENTFVQSSKLTFLARSPNSWSGPHPRFIWGAMDTTSTRPPAVSIPGSDIVVSLTWRSAKSFRTVFRLTMRENMWLAEHITYFHHNRERKVDIFIHTPFIVFCQCRARVFGKTAFDCIFWDELSTFEEKSNKLNQAERSNLRNST